MEERIPPHNLEAEQSVLGAALLSPDAMYDVLTHHFGNPSSQYPAGQEMKKAVEGWRAVIAGALHCPP